MICAVCIVDPEKHDIKPYLEADPDAFAGSAKKKLLYSRCIRYCGNSGKMQEAGASDT